MDGFPSVEHLGHWERKTINDITHWQTLYAKYWPDRQGELHWHDSAPKVMG